MGPINLIWNKKPYTVLMVLGFLVFGNTLFNEYALDDGLLITNNQYVQQGFSGIYEIFTTSSADSYFQAMGAKEKVFTGGRYRPLSIATFAIEHSIFGETPFFRHFNNLTVYLLTVALMFYFLKEYLFKENIGLAFLSSLIFLIHPLHSEVVANVKSRDELLSLFFIVSCLILVFRLSTKLKLSTFFGLITCYLLALFTKEYAIVLVIICPIMLFVLGKKKNLIGSVFVVLICCTFIYGLIRFNYVGLIGGKQTEILNNPYLYANGSEGLGTKMWVLFKYLFMFVFPFPLSADYSYKTIPYVNFSFWGVWLAISIYVGISIWGVWLIKKKNHLAIPVLFFLGSILFVSNILLEIGSFMSCRLVYHASFGYSIVVGWVFNLIWKKGINWSSIYKWGIIGCFLVYVLFFVGYSIKRNTLWKNDASLFTHDVLTVPNSVLVNGNAAKAYIEFAEKESNFQKKTDYLEKAVNYLNKAISIHPKFVQGYLNLGSAYFHQEKYDKMEKAWNKGRKLFPTHPNFEESYDPIMEQVFYKKGLDEGSKGDFKKAVIFLEKAAKYTKKNANVFYHLGGAYYSEKDFIKAKEIWLKCLKINPNHLDANKGLKALGYIEGN